jgi:thiol:disulfide interchange protein DsbD
VQATSRCSFDFGKESVMNCRAKVLWMGCSALLAILLYTGQAWAQFGLSGPKDVLTARASLPAGALQPGKTATLTLQLSIKKPYHVNANPASEDYLVPTTATVNKTKGITAGKPSYPAPLMRKFGFYPKPLKVYEGTTTVKVPITLARGAAVPASLSGSVRYQACDHNSCLPPATATWKTASGTSGAAQSTSDGASGVVAASQIEADAVALQKKYAVPGLPTIVFLDGQGKERADLRAGEELTLAAMTQKLDAVQSGETLKPSEESSGGWQSRLENSSLWVQLLLVFAGGLLLNLTPCVYPMIPITVGYFGAQSEGRTGKTFGLAAFYVLGLALMYSSLGVFAALTGTLFGSALQSQYAVGFVAVVLFALGLSMLGVFTIQPPQFIMARSGAKKGAWGALGMGALLGLVAAPCVGPIVAALLTYVGAKAAELGRAQGALFGFAMFFTLALGLGLPYLLLGTFSGSIKSMPKSGPWLERLKKIFAVPLLIAAAYYAYLAVKPTSTAQAAQSTVHWPAATLAKLEAARQQGKPVVLDFRADWCLPCLKMEKEIFSKSEVLKYRGDVELLQVDLTRATS